MNHGPAALVCNCHDCTQRRFLEHRGGLGAALQRIEAQGAKPGQIDGITAAIAAEVVPELALISTNLLALGDQQMKQFDHLAGLLRQQSETLDRLAEAVDFANQRLNRNEGHIGELQGIAEESRKQTASYAPMGLGAIERAVAAKAARAEVGKKGSRNKPKK